MKTLRAPVGLQALAAAIGDAVTGFACVRTSTKIGERRPAQGAATSRHCPRRRHPALIRAVGAALLFAGLAAVAAGEPEVPPAPAPAYHAPTDPGELLKMDEPMRRFFRERLLPGGYGENQLRKLVDAILQPDGLNFAYDTEGVFDAREAFRQRRGNCVSFAFLVVAVAREYGYTVSFQSVASATRWERHGDLILSVNHINVHVEGGGDAYCIDLRPDLTEGLRPHEMQMIEDKRACAQFYYTLGVFNLGHAQTAEALQLMTLATKIDPDCAEAWANLASVQSHLDNLTDARASFERALRADSNCITALDGFVSVLLRLGSPDDRRIAAKYERRAQAIRDRNPYYQQKLAERAQEQGDWIAANKLLRRAIALKDDEPQFYQQQVTVLLKLGRDEDARRVAAKLEKLRLRLAAAENHPGR